MATDIKISELNEITANDDINYIIVNDRENAGDEGITKKITLENFLTPNIVQETNILNDAVTRDKIEDLAVDCSKIASNTITCNQILECTINNPSLDSNSVDNRVLNNNCNFTVKGLLVNDGCINISNPTNGCLQITSGVTRLNGVQYNWPDIQTADRFLKTDGSGNLSWQEAVPGESTALVFAEIMPVGTIIPWGGADDAPDDKWLACNGGTFNGPQYPELSAAIGENFGARIGEGFRLPDLRGKVPVGSAPNGASDGTDTCNFVLGATGGKYNHRLTSQQSGLPSHNHINGLGMTNESSNLFGGCNLGGAFSDYPQTCDKVTHNDNKGDFSPYTQTRAFDAAESHNNIQPYMVTKYIIKARPDDIQQFNPEVGPGLSARDVTGQTANVTLTSLEIGLKVTDDFQFDESGRLDIANVSFTKLDLPSNFPVQTVQAVKRDTQTISGPALGAVGWVDIAGLSATITRNVGSESGKVRIQGTINTSTSNGNSGIAVRIRRNGATISGATGNSAGSRIRATGNAAYAGAYGSHNIVFDYIDSPNITDTDIVYNVQARIYSGVTGWINRSYYDSDTNDYNYRTISTLTLTELTP